MSMRLGGRGPATDRTAADRAAERAAVESDSAVNRDAAIAGGPDADGGADPDAARRQRIAIAAYYLAERRGFAPGADMEDWLAAEAALEGGSPNPDTE